jgi:hypothetical protein
MDKSEQTRTDEYDVQKNVDRILAGMSCVTFESSNDKCDKNIEYRIVDKDGHTIQSTIISPPSTIVKNITS